MERIFLLIHAIMEITAGIIFIFYPSVIPVFASTNSQVTYLTNMYGIAALTIGFMSFQVWRKFYEEEVLKTGLLVFALFHTGISLTQWINPVLKPEMIGAGVLHSALAILFGMMYRKVY